MKRLAAFLSFLSLVPMGLFLLRRRTKDDLRDSANIIYIDKAGRPVKHEQSLSILRRR